MGCETSEKLAGLPAPPLSHQENSTRVLVCRELIKLNEIIGKMLGAQSLTATGQGQELQAAGCHLQEQTLGVFSPEQGPGFLSTWWP